jgi:hypothetical protein
MDWSTLPKAEPLPYRKLVRKSIDDYTPLIGAAIWTLEEGINLLATFKAENLYEKEEDRSAHFLVCWQQVFSTLFKTLKTYELREKNFLVHAENCGIEPDRPRIILHESTAYPDKFIEWAMDLSLPIPSDFHQKLMRNQKKHIANRPINGPGSLTAKEKRELGRLRREQENFDLAIKATVRAVQFCIKVDRRVKRDEFFDLLAMGEYAISKELFERILPLLPPEYRETSGAPTSCKIGDPNET